jgi:hypothetical protein
MAFRSLVQSGVRIKDRKSVFLPHVASITCKSDVPLVLLDLKRSSNIAKATHNIFAYRVVQGSTIVQVEHVYSRNAIDSMTLRVCL